MIYYKTKLKYITCATFTKDCLKLALNSNEYFQLNNYEGPEFKIGRLSISYINSSNKLLSLYLLDYKNKPFQIYGDKDVLFEGSLVHDESQKLKKQIAYATQICISAFSVLTKEEIESHKHSLLLFENKIFELMIDNEFGWKNSKNKSASLLENIDLPEYLQNIMNTSILIAPMPKNAVYKTSEIDLSEYPESKLIK